MPEEELLEAPKEEAPAEDTEAKEDAARTAAIDEMEKATQKALDAMREKDNPKMPKSWTMRKKKPEKSLMVFPNG